MKTSTKLTLIAAFVLGATSAASAQTVTNVADPSIWGGASLGWNANQTSSLQNARKYPNGRDPLKAGAAYAAIHVASVADPALWGGASLGWNANQTSSLQNARKYPNGGDPLKAGWNITVHPTH